MLKNVISTEELRDKEILRRIFQEADKFVDEDTKDNLTYPLKGKILATLFYEPSTRTRFSFETAMHKLGGSVITNENAGEFSSAVKGETIEDTMRIVSGYADAIVMRHPEKGSAKKALFATQVPLINAGDGAGEHPTQALLDLYTIQKELGQIENLKIALIGDLLYGRTIHSLLPLLSLYRGIKLHLISPKELALPQKYKDYLVKEGVEFSETSDLLAEIGEFDVLYITRVQKERFTSLADYEKVKDAYVINASILEKMKPKALILHPLPRVNEIAPEVDKDPRAGYFRQAKNGVYVRMAILNLLVGGIHD